MKKLFITGMLFVTFIGVANNKTSDFENKAIDSCTDIYKSTRDAALAEGFNYSQAQQIGAAAYYACKKEKAVVSIN